jgi:hypothetical protein
MPRFNREDIDRKTNKPNPITTEGLTPDLILNRAEQTRRDDDMIRTAKRSVYDIDYAIKWYIENEIQPQITADKQLLSVPVIFANGEKWDNVRRLGYMRDEKGMLQSPMIMLKRNSVTEDSNHKGIDVNRAVAGNSFVYKSKYNERNRYEDELFPIPKNQPQPSDKIYVVDIPRYVTMEYDLMIWCDFTPQLNDLIDQLITYNRFSWGNEGNKFLTIMGSVSFETVNTVAEDRLVRATIPLTIQATLLAEQETRISTIKKAYSIKKVTFVNVVDIDGDLFGSTAVSSKVLQAQSFVANGGSLIASNGSTSTQIDPATMSYLTNLTEKIATYSNATTVTVIGLAAINPVNLAVATVNEFDVYINGQYIDKPCYTWTPSNITNQSIVFNTTTLGYTIEATDVIVVKGRWT